MFAVEGDNVAILDGLTSLLATQPEALLGVNGLKSLVGHLNALGVDSGAVKVNPRLARGLDYYTGPVFESILPAHPHIGSLTGGGRYDELIGLYSGRDLPGVGTTIGLDRIFATMEQLGMVETTTATVTRVLVAAYSDGEIQAALSIVGAFREAGIPSELFPTTGKLKKPFAYADKMGIGYVGVVGPDEAADPNRLKISLKDLASGDQEVVPLDQAISKLHVGESS